MFSSSRKKSVQKAIPQSNTFAAETFLLRRVSESSRYKWVSLMMFVAGFGLLTLGTWVLNDFNFLTFTKWLIVDLSVIKLIAERYANSFITDNFYLFLCMYWLIVV